MHASHMPSLELERPHLRGMLHAIACPAVLAVGVWLAWQAPSERTALASVVYVAGLAAIFGTSGLYHRRTWSPRAFRRMRQLDHCMIFVGMATTYTAFWLVALSGPFANAILYVAWIGAAAGVLVKVVFIDAPKSLHWAIYFTFGLLGLLVVPGLARTMGEPAVAALLAGGVVLAVGSLAFLLGRPDPLPRHFGHHEVFHLCTVVGVAIHLATFASFVIR